MADLAGRVALVTGGARGLGAAAGKALSNAGAKVVLSDVLDGAETASAIGGAYVKHDVTSDPDWANAIRFVTETYGGLDILVNNAGVFWVRPIAMTTLEAFRHMQQVNVEGVFLGLKHAIPAIAERAQRWEGGGAIVNISSVAGLVGSANTLAYSASKGAVRLMTKSTAVQHAKDNIRANSVHPGVMPPMRTSGRTADPEVRAKRMNVIPMRRPGEADEVANAILFLASDESSYITGTELVVDGGAVAI